LLTFIVLYYKLLYIYISLTDASPDTFETPQPLKGPSSSISVNTTNIDDGKHEDSKSKNTGKYIELLFINIIID